MCTWAPRPIVNFSIKGSICGKIWRLTYRCSSTHENTHTARYDFSMLRKISEIIIKFRNVRNLWHNFCTAIKPDDRRIFHCRPRPRDSGQEFFCDARSVCGSRGVTTAPQTRQCLGARKVMGALCGWEKRNFSTRLNVTGGMWCFLQGWENLKLRHANLLVFVTIWRQKKNRTAAFISVVSCRQQHSRCVTKKAQREIVHQRRAQSATPASAS